MATIYIFNENIIEQSGTAGTEVTVIIGNPVVGTYSVKTIVEADGKARVNASPFYQMMFASADKNGNTAFTTTKALGTDTLKYGYLDAYESTEQYSTQRSKYSASTNPSACQSLVRFLDHYGNWCYWVFESGTRGTSDNAEGEMLPSLVGKHTIRRPQAKSSAETITMCAPKVDEEIFQFLCDIRRSINVCIKIGGVWVPCVVSSGTSSWVRDTKKMNRQDFEFSVVLNENKISL